MGIGSWAIREAYLEDVSPLLSGGGFPQWRERVDVGPAWIRGTRDHFRLGAAVTGPGVRAEIAARGGWYLVTEAEGVFGLCVPVQGRSPALYGLE